ncbi:MAG TPA: response regulator [Chloroflexia bacterium]|nr:response regulator [Chloroflexia bacterium]
MLESTQSQQNQPVKLAESFISVITPTMHIVVIDRHVESATQICTLLSSQGYHATFESSPEQVLEQLANPHQATFMRGTPDLIIYDMQGDEEEDLDFLRNVRRLGYPYIPVMIVTSLESNHVFEKAVIDLEADDFVIKPVRSSELLLRVHLLLRGMATVAA